MSQTITTELLGEHPLLSSINTSAELSTAWIRSGDGLVGFGVYKKLEVKDRGQAAQIAKKKMLV